MRNFTLTNYPSGECRSYGRLMKALLLSTAMVLFHFTSLQAQETDQPNAVYYGDGDPTAVDDASKANNLFLSIAKNDYDVTTNPDLSPNTTCGNLRVVLLLDESGSILNTNGVEQVRDATLEFAQVFQGSPAQVTVIEFGSFARTIDLGSPTVNSAFIENLEAYLYTEYDGQSYNPIQGNPNDECPLNYTNWQDALEEVSEASSLPPNLLLFLTDGNPSAFNVPVSGENTCGYEVSANNSAALQIGLDNAVIAANELKNPNGVHIFTYGVGNGINVDKLQLISGEDEFGTNGSIFTDDYSVGSFEDLADNLTAGLNTICGTEIAIEKSVDFDQVCGSDPVVNFTITVTNTGGSNDIDAANVVVQDVFPDAFSNLNIELINGDIVADLDGQTLTINVGNLEANLPPESLPTVVVSATISGSNGVYTNIATASAANANDVEDDATVEKAAAFSPTETITACDSFTLNPNDFVENPEDETVEMINTPGTFERTIIGENEFGCPLEVELIITINERIETQAIEETSCGVFEWDVNDDGLFDPETEPTLSASGTYTEELTNDEGLCELATLVLEIEEITIIENDITICFGDEYSIPGGQSTYNSPGTYTDILSNPGGGCPITLITNLSFGEDCCIDAGGDSDGDGVCDDDDGCPEDENKTEPGLCGCGEVDIDENNNGICDSDEDPCEFVTCEDDGNPCTTVTCENGDCVTTDLPDSDGDGVCDVEDGCPEDENKTEPGLCGCGEVDIDENDNGICDSDEDPCEFLNCDDGDPCTIDSCIDGVCSNVFQDADGDGICDANDPCPQLAGLENEDACETEFGQEGTVENCECVPDNNPGVIDCDDWVVYLADIVSGGVTDIYEVDFSGGNASLSLIATSQIQVHIAYNAQDNLIYAVSNADGSYRTLNPHDENPEFSETTFIEADINRVTQAAINADGKLIIGNSGSDIVYSINLDNNNVAVFDSYAPIEGGDIAFGEDGTAFMATKEGNGGLYVLWPDEVQSDVLIGDLPGNVTGMALSSTNQLLVSNDGSTSFLVRELSGADNGETIDILLGGSPFPLSAGDMASGCSTFSNPNEGDCNDFSTFYANHGPGISGTDIYGVTYSGTNAVLSPIGNVGFQAHIAYNAEENIIYLVNANGSNIVLLDPDAGIQGSVPINGSINQLFAVVYNPSDELLYVGDANDDEIYTLDPVTGDIVLFSEGSSVDGGDLALQDGKLYLADRSGRDLYEVIAGVDNDVLVGELPSNVNGMAQANNVTGLVVSRGNTDEFVEVDAADGATIQTYTAILDGESFSLSNGDMAAGCGDADDVDVCADSGECYGVTADYVQGTTQGGGGLVANRANPANALGEPEGTDALVFTTLGYGGSLTFQFDGVVPNGPGDDIEVVETSFNNPGCESYPEYADVSVSVDGSTYYYLGTVCKGDPFVDISDADVEIPFECVSYVRVANNDGLTTSPDGFDIDGIVALHNCEDNGNDEGPALTGVDADNTLTSFPNPTSGLSQAVFITAETERATLEVYDMNGRLVETLFNQVANANQEYRVDFDGMNLPNGVFVYRLTTDSEVTVEKFMIAR